LSRYRHGHRSNHAHVLSMMNLIALVHKRLLQCHQFRSSRTFRDRHGHHVHVQTIKGFSQYLETAHVHHLQPQLQLGRLLKPNSPHGHLFRTMVFMTRLCRPGIRSVYLRHAIAQGSLWMQIFLIAPHRSAALSRWRLFSIASSIAWATTHVASLTFKVSCIGSRASRIWSLGT